MQVDYLYVDLVSDSDWETLHRELDEAGESSALQGLLDAFRAGGAAVSIEESAYIDRDFSAAYAGFYSTLFHMRPRFCRRIHFLSSQHPEVRDAPDLEELGLRLEAAAADYMGFIVIRPLRHAPVGSAILSARHATRPGMEISVRSTFRVHLLGAELSVQGMPVTEQDKRIGSCAQATIWAAGRHFHNGHSMPWFSMTDITEAALKPTDSILARSLPAGSDFLTDDNMVRALRAMGEHPIVYAPEESTGWEELPARTIARYLGSGIPVIIGLKRDGDTGGVGHAVVAVGMVTGGPASNEDAASGANIADRVTHFVVNDDQRGAYRELAISGPRQADDYVLDDAIFLMVPLPAKVYMKAEVAETLARDKIALVAKNRSVHLRQSGLRQGRKKMRFEEWTVDPDFYATEPQRLVARTYLTYGWKYKHRLVRNVVSEELKDEAAWVQFPRYVWIVEFALPGDLDDADQCRRRVRAHVVLDATGSRYEDSVLLTHLPGIIIGNSFDPARPGADPIVSLQVLRSDAPYFPKIRGMRDFAACVSAVDAQDATLRG